MSDAPQADEVRWMHLALDEARAAARRGEVPIGAVVVRDGIVLGQAGNEPIATSDPTAHAEILALRRAAAAARNYRLPGATLYVTVEPCAMCAGAAVLARLERVVFGCLDPKAGAVESVFQVVAEPRLNHRVPWTAGVCEDEARRLLTEFFRARRG